MTRQLAAGLMMAIACGRIAAAPSPAASGPVVDLIPTIGVGGGENLEASTPGVPPATSDPSASIGFAVDVFVTPDAWFEAFVSHQTLHFASDPSSVGSPGFDFGIDYLQFGGGYGPAEGHVQPYVAASVGLTRYGASSGGSGSALGASGSLGGGMKIPVSRRVALRFEVRGYATLSNAAVSVTCGPGCFVQFAADGWYQFAGSFGVTIRI
jgi:hypothetical protein